MKRIHLIPTLLTLANAFCGLLAISKAVDALALSSVDSTLFYQRIEFACWMVLLAMVFDALDGKVARMTGSQSDFGAQLDSFSDALTFGVAPAVLAKVLIEHEAPLVDYAGHPRLHFVAAAAFSLMAILRLARFNLETEQEAHAHLEFRGLPSPAAAGAVVSTILMYLLHRPELELSEGTPTVVGTVLAWFRGDSQAPQVWMLPTLAMMLPLLGLLMVSRVRYAHVVSMMTSGRSQFVTLVWVVFGFLIYLVAPKPVLFVLFNGFVLLGLVQAVFHRRSAEAGAAERARP